MNEARIIPTHSDPAMILQMAMAFWPFKVLSTTEEPALSSVSGKRGMTVVQLGEQLGWPSRGI